MLADRMRMVESSAIPSIDFQESRVNATSQTAYTFTGVSLGAAASGRLIVLSVYGGANTGRSISSVTVGGNSASAIVTNTTDGFGVIALYSIVVSTGTSADVVVTFSGDETRCGVGVWALYDVNSTAFHSNSNWSAGGLTNISTTLNTATNGITVQMALGGGTAIRTYTWSVGTEDFDQTISGDSEHTGAHQEETSSATGATIQVTASGTKSGMGIVVASWEP